MALASFGKNAEKPRGKSFNLGGLSLAGPARSYIYPGKKSLAHGVMAGQVKGWGRDSDVCCIANAGRMSSGWCSWSFGLVCYNVFTNFACDFNMDVVIFFVGMNVDICMRFSLL